MAKRMGQVFAVLLAGVALAGCSEETASAPGAPPPGVVKVVTAQQEELPITNDLPGRIAPTRLAEVRPRVSGIIVERVFEQGSLVKEGDVLYKIDPAPFQVRVDSAEATLRRAQAAQLQARQTSDRQQQLRRSNVASQQEFDNAIAMLAQADAEVAVAEAGVAEARLNLQYANVTAPISGRIGRALITEGALVSATGSENLATIQQLDPIYADFTQPAADLIRLRKALQDGQLMTGPNEAEVNLLFDNGSRYPVAGRLLFSEAAVDETTGQVTLRGEFPNPHGDLLPGMYVRVQIQQGIQKAAIAVPQQAVQRDAGGQASVLVVNAEDTVEQRRVSVDRAVGDRWVISEGINTGDRVVAEGFQKTAPGAKVKPEPWTDAVEANAGSAAPATN
ncbi:efflux RND transporter periplasmic adaptor subunit [Rhizobium sp. RM]|uniref:efflux RND transporter periplasmic adaptor subunit n=1 Tax=Rhizobium/Agrobacterium group TaxID=227290 RepID=UPI00110E9A34|nr:efflux RND transporter periplasmic adaptor subunit [Rhizobium sp. RM]NWJ23610.1 efflux RND transporter periplasmic adaptor subunit [Rhizobium sp. RM]TMV19443.1 efflux RND transporter periplasmic adaptor subunit [Rhizobium sp. Td3]